MKGLVFGKTGQVARCLAGRLRSLDEVSFLDRGQADLSRPETLGPVIEAFGPDVVINTAAYTAVDRAESEEALAHTVNAEAPAAMAEACARTGAWLVHYSTDYVFDGAAGRPYTEEDPTSPLNVYGRTKLAGEAAVRERCGRHFIFRTSWVYSNFGNNFLNTMIRLAGERDTLSIVSDQIGAPTYAGAIAEATDEVLRAVIAGGPGDGEAAGTYHMTCGGRTSWHGFARAIFEATGRFPGIEVSPIPTAEYPTPARRPSFSVLSNEKLMGVFSVRLEPWEDALRKCLSERAEQQQ